MPWYPGKFTRGLPVIGSGPIASAPDAGTWWAKAPGKIGGLYYNTVATADTPVGPCVAVRAFHNEGIDYGDWGRPSFISKLATNLPWTIDFSVSIKKTEAHAQYVLALVDSDPPAEQQIALFFLQSNNTVFLRVGGISQSAAYTLPASPANLKIRITSDGVKSNLWIDGVLIVANLSNGSFTSTNNFRFFGYAFVPSFNAELDGFYMRIFDVYANNQNPITIPCIACFNANNPAQWNGGASAVDSAGNPITFTDSAPLGRVAYSWLSLAKAQQWGLLT